MLKSVFNKVAALVLSCEICEILQNTYFQKHLQTTATDNAQFNPNFLYWKE